MAQYKYSVEKCDVLPGSLRKLENFRAMRTKWLNALEQMERPAGIWQQINEMLWAELLWRTLNEARNLHADEPKPETGFNGYVCAFLDSGYVAMQASAIRRLVDDDPNTYSLLSLVNSIEKNAHLISREIFISHDGLPYDPEPVKRRHLDEIAEIIQRTGKPYFGSRDPHGPRAWTTSERGHTIFDRLSNTSADKRSRRDTLSPRIFERLKSKLTTCRSIVRFATKFLAHADSRAMAENLKKSDTALSLKRVLTTQRVIYQVANFIDSTLLWNASHHVPPVLQGNILANLDKKMVHPDHFPKLRAFYRVTEESMGLWTNERWSGSF